MEDPSSSSCLTILQESIVSDQDNVNSYHGNWQMVGLVGLPLFTLL